MLVSNQLSQNPSITFWIYRGDIMDSLTLLKILILSATYNVIVDGKHYSEHSKEKTGCGDGYNLVRFIARDLISWCLEAIHICTR